MLLISGVECKTTIEGGSDVANARIRGSYNV